MLTQERLKSELSYNSQTGMFVWLKTGKGRSIHRHAGCVSYRKIQKAKYVVIMIDKKLYAAHRLAWLYMTGNFPEEVIDHINGDGQDNRFVNLRAVTKQDNHKNMRMFSNNNSGIAGVSWDKFNKKWRVTIWDSNKQVSLGRHDDLFEAACIRKSAEKLYQYHANHGSLRLT